MKLCKDKPSGMVRRFAGDFLFVLTAFWLLWHHLYSEVINKGFGLLCAVKIFKISCTILCLLTYLQGDKSTRGGGQTLDSGPEWLLLWP